MRTRMHKNMPACPCDDKLEWQEEGRQEEFRPVSMTTTMSTSNIKAPVTVAVDPNW